MNRGRLPLSRCSAHQSLGRTAFLGPSLIPIRQPRPCLVDPRRADRGRDSAEHATAHLYEVGERVACRDRAGTLDPQDEVVCVRGLRTP
jgi:hypothetical protein